MNEFFDMTAEEFDDEKDENKRKNRNLSEKKRRDQFNLLINELCTIINYNSAPMSNPMDVGSESVGFGNKQKTDKSSILRASIAFLRSHSDVWNKANDQRERETNDQKAYESESETSCESQSIFSWKPPFLVNDEFVHLMLEALDSFLIIIEANSEGKIVYVSETVFPLLGLMPMQLNQKSQNNSDDKITIYDLIHEEERSFVENFLVPNQVNSGYEMFASILLHFRDNDFDCESQSYQLVRLIGSFYDINDLRANLMYGPSEQKCFVGIGRLQTPKFLRELTVNVFNDDNQFVSRNSLEWKFLYLDHRASPIIGYLPFEILGTSGFDYYHWNDLDEIVAGHEQLMRTGEGTSCIHRFLTKSQQWIWLRTNYYIAYHHWNSKPEFIVCTHTVVKESDVSYVKSRKINERFNTRVVETSAVTKDNDNISDYSTAMESTSTEDMPHSSTTSMSWSSRALTDSDPSQDFMSSQTSSGGMHSNDMSVDSQMSSPKKQSILHSFLKQKHSLLEHQIRQQQEELRRVTEQMVLVSAVNNEG